MLAKSPAVILLLLAASLQADSIRLVPIVSGLDRPVQLVAANDGLHVAQQDGRVSRIDDGRLVTEADLRSVVGCCENGGLLSIAFDPLYAANRRMYALYADRNGDAALARVTDGRVEVMLVVPQPKLGVPNHHGGTVAFGPDGFLYASIGDGGAVEDVTLRAQQLDRLHGKLLRIDVRGEAAYSIPPDNPYAGTPGARGEIWASGLRNPWRFSFDSTTGTLHLADVGHESWEEVNILSVAAARGMNFGWPVMEGSRCFPPNTICNPAGFVLPQIEYSREGGCSITGGFRYRGTALPWRGAYIYGDFCSGRIWAAIESGTGTWTPVLIADTDAVIVSFGEDAAGELYVVDYAGTVSRIVSAMARQRAVRPPS